MGCGRPAEMPGSGCRRRTRSHLQQCILCNAAEGENHDIAMDFLAFLGSEEGQRIQGESGVAIPAYNGLEDTWVQSFADQGYEVNVGNLIEQFDYSVKYVNNASRRVWEPEVEQTVLDIYAGTLTVDEGIQQMQDEVTQAIADQ